MKCHKSGVLILAALTASWTQPARGFEYGNSVGDFEFTNPLSPHNRTPPRPTMVPAQSPSAEPTSKKQAMLDFTYLARRQRMLWQLAKQPDSTNVTNWSEWSWRRQIEQAILTQVISENPTNADFNIKVSFTVSRDLKISNLKILSKSDNKFLNSALPKVLKSLNGSSLLEFPKELSSNSEDCTIEYSSSPFRLLPPPSNADAWGRDTVTNPVSELDCSTRFALDHFRVAKYNRCRYSLRRHPGNVVAG